MPTPARLPGVFFEASPSPPADELPRMDVAAFVGFAAAGPLHVPVLVEDPARFRAVFSDLDGAAPKLAWDADRGEPRRAHLATAVEAFFANGGARCWAVRVADEASAVRHRFRLPGLVAAADSAASPPRPVEARARAAGSWCEELAAATALLRDPLRWRVEERSRDALPLVLAAGAYRLDLAAGAVDLQPGDLVELLFTPGSPSLLLFVDRVEPLPGGVRLWSAALPSTPGAETPGAFWVQPATFTGSPSAVSLETDESGPPAPLAENVGLSLANDWLGSPAHPDRLPAVRRLSFELALFRGQELAARLGGLTFARRHPRYWAALPIDEALFGRVGREQVADRAGRQAATAAEGPATLSALLGEAFDPLRERFAGLFAEAADPRFPLAGPAPTDTSDFYLPWGMVRDRTAAAAVPLDRPFLPGTRLERDGLATFSAGLFLDPALGRLYQGSLLSEAEHWHDLRGLPLRGLHSLVSLSEVSLLAVPDAVHRGWTRELPRSAKPLGAPELLPFGAIDAAGRYPVDWTAVAGANHYRLERDTDPAFPRAVVVHAGEEITAHLVLPPGCPAEVWLRVRAEHDGEAGPWSNTRGARLPLEPFAACAGGRPAGLVLRLGAAGSPPALAVVWEAEDAAAPIAASYQLEEAADAGFATARVAGPERPADSGFVLPEGRPTARYYRVRGLAEDRPGPWSNSVRVPGTERDDYTELAVPAYDPAALLAVQRASLRLAAARADLLALLSLPDHYRADDALDHLARLTPGGPPEPPAPPLPPGAVDPAVGVPPLTLGELPALGFGALYHPWLVGRGGGAPASSSLRRQPPEGAVGGTMAALALGPGAWRAPANRPLAGVLALDPPLGLEAWRRLSGVNAVLHHPRGFLLLSADTLSDHGSLRPISVRRLLILLRRLALREGQGFVFEPNDAFLGDLVRHRFELLLGDLYRRGAFAGATAEAGFRVVASSSINPPDAVDRGRFVVELQVAPARALAFLTVRLVDGGAGRLAVQEVA